MPVAERGEWREVYYRHWEHLERARAWLELDLSLEKLREADPDDPLLVWFRARAFNRKARGNTLDAKTAGSFHYLLDDLKVVATRYEMQLRELPPGTEAGEIRRRLRLLHLEMAKLYHAFWKHGGYGEGDDPSARKRDRAIELCRAPDLANDLDAQRLLLQIYDKILSQWWGFEFEEKVAGRLMTKSEVEAMRAAVLESIGKAEAEQRKGRAP